jgi:holo-[acyl-carrier protein] synthase
LIIGIGSDLSDIRRIQDTLDRFGARFTGRIFTDIEQARSERKGVFWRDMGVVNMASGQPTMQLTGGAAVRLAALIPAGMRPIIHLSLTDDHPYAQAFVVIEALPQ